MAPEELLQFTICNCKGDYSNRWCSRIKNGVKCIAAYGNCKGIKCNNSSDLESGEDSDLDLDSPETVYIIATEAFYNN